MADNQENVWPNTIQYLVSSDRKIVFVMFKSMENSINSKSTVKPDGIYQFSADKYNLTRSIMFADYWLVEDKRTIDTITFIFNKKRCWWTETPDWCHSIKDVIEDCQTDDNRFSIKEESLMQLVLALPGSIMNHKQLIQASKSN